MDTTNINLIGRERMVDLFAVIFIKLTLEVMIIAGPAECTFVKSNRSIFEIITIEFIIQ